LSARKESAPARGQGDRSAEFTEKIRQQSADTRSSYRLAFAIANASGSALSLSRCDLC